MNNAVALYFNNKLHPGEYIAIAVTRGLLLWKLSAMMYPKSPAFGCAIIFTSLILTACGGGGGGGSDNGNNGNPGGNAGENNLVAIDRSNGKALFQTVYTMAYLSDSLLSSAPDIIASFMATDGQATGSQSIDESFDCTTGSAKLQGSVNRSNHTGQVDITYHDCVDGDSASNGYSVRYNGTMHIKVRAADGGGRPTAFDYTYENYRFEYLGTEAGSSYEGHIAVDPEASGSKLSASLTLTNLHSHESISTSDYVAHYPTNSTYGSLPYQAQRSGHITYSRIGTVLVSTANANGAQTYLAGANQSRLRAELSYSGSDNLRLALDANGDGVYESYARLPLDLLDTAPGSNIAPTVNVSNPGLIPNVNEDSMIPINGVFDPQYDFLSYSVKVVQSPTNAEIKLSLQDDNSFTLHTDIGGEYVVALTVNDGNGGTTTQNIPLHVAWLAPVIPAPTYNNNIDVTDNVSIDLRANNAGTGPLTYRLVNGPAGMTIDSQGLLHWQPANFPFFPNAEVQATVEVKNADHSVAIPLPFVMAGANINEPLVRTGIAVPGWTKNVFLGDFNGDGDKELLLTDGSSLIYTAKLHNGTYSIDWVYPYQINNGEIINHILPVDLNGDGKYEIVVRSKGKISIIDSAHTKVIRSVDLGGTTGDGMAAADIDGDGKIELVVLLDHVGIVLDAATLTERWRTPYMPYKSPPIATLGTGDVVIGNVDHDAGLELVFSFGYVYDGATRQLEWSPADDFGQVLSIGDIDGDGVDEIFGSIKLGVSTAWAYSALSKTALWQFPLSAGFFEVRDIITAQMDNDSAREVLVNYPNGTIAAFDASLAAVSPKWSVGPAAGAQSVLATVIGDDGSHEVAWAASSSSNEPNHIVVFNALSQQVDFDAGTTLYSSGPYVGGLVLNSTNTSPILFATQQVRNGSSGNYLVGIDPISGTMHTSQALDNAQTSLFDFCVADFDLDQNNEILLGADDANIGYLGAYDYLNDAWKRQITASSYKYHSSLACSDFNNDGHTDIVSVLDKNIEIDDIYNQSSLWSSATLPVSQIGKIGGADLDNDGNIEVVYQYNNTQLAMLHKSGGSYGQQATYSFAVTAAANCSLSANLTGICATASNVPWTIDTFAIMDVDGDGLPEIVFAANSIFSLSVNGAETYASFLVVLNSDLSERSRVLIPGKITAIAPEPIQRGTALIATRYIDAATNSPAQYRTQLIDIDSGVWVWRSPLLTTEIATNSLHYNSAIHRLTFSTATAMYITR